MGVFAGAAYAGPSQGNTAQPSFPATALIGDRKARLKDLMPGDGKGKNGKQKPSSREELGEQMKKCKEMLERAGKLSGKKAQLLVARIKKKAGTTQLRQYRADGDEACIENAEKCLKEAKAEHEQLGSTGIDYAKALYWLSVASYALGKNTESEAHADACIQKAGNENGWLQDMAKNIRSLALMEINEENINR